MEGIFYERDGKGHTEQRVVDLVDYSIISNECKCVNTTSDRLLAVAQLALYPSDLPSKVVSSLTAPLQRVPVPCRTATYLRLKGTYSNEFSSKSWAVGSYLY